MYIETLLSVVTVEFQVRAIEPQRMIMTESLNIGLAILILKQIYF